MAVPHPVMDLMSDHRRIEAVMNALENKLLPVAEPFPAEFIGRALTFFIEYADCFHHHREEEFLFPAMAANGVPVEGGPIAVMLHDHMTGRKLLAGIRGNLEEAGKGDHAAQAAVRTYASRYIDLLRQHIWKEDNILFTMAQRVLDEPTMHRLTGRFAEQSATDPTAAQSVENHRQFADDLRCQLG